MTLHAAALISPSDLRVLTDAELDDVNGGFWIAALFIGAVVAGLVLGYIDGRNDAMNACQP